MNIVSGIHLDVLGYVAKFLMFFSKFFVEKVIVKLTIDVLVQPLSMGEFLRFIGIWLVITRASPGNLHWQELWSKDQVSRERRAPFRINDLMSSNQTEEIIKHLNYTSVGPPPIKDPFWEGIEMIKAWNENMDSILQVVWSHVWMSQY